MVHQAGERSPVSVVPKVPRRIAAVIINSLKGGVVPRIGLPYVTVGREREIQALLHDLELVADGGASFRFLVGRYGAGKSFLLQTIRTHAMGKGFVVADADLSPERRLQGGQGQGLATYRELVRNLSTKTRPEGGALQLVLDRWVAALRESADPEAALSAQLAPIRELVCGFDFTQVLRLYYRASLEGSEELQAGVVKWLRGEFRTKTEARGELGVNACITDDTWYEYLKLFAQFLVGAGYQGLVVLIDELVNLYKIPNATSRQYNYEKILTMYNDTLQGKARHLGVIMGGTPQSIEDRRRGVFSYEALRSRLTQGRFASAGLSDMLAPVIHLEPLTYEELLVLIEKLAEIHAGYFGYERTLTEAQLVSFLQVEFGRVGADTHLTPREVIRDFIELLDIVCQNPG
ncbi:MAG TPA: ATP-binding protein, partial [Candidatus Olsenella avicola]|nr:ATP-binding protein [Candidatus Olsenella avicola]